MNAGDILRLDADKKRYTLIIVAIEDCPAPVELREPPVLSEKDLPRHTHGVELYSGENPCVKCERFWRHAGKCCGGIRKNHDRCFIPKEGSIHNV